jgi:hypothetical protein
MKSSHFGGKLELDSKGNHFYLQSARGFDNVAIAVFTGRLHSTKQHSATMKAILFQLDAALNE